MTQQWNAEGLRESLLWTASSLAALGKEQDVIVLEGRRRTVGEILDEANDALEVDTPPASAQDDAKDAARYRTVRQSVTDEANGADQISAAGEAIGLRPGAYPTPDQFDAMIDHIAASQQQEG